MPFSPDYSDYLRMKRIQKTIDVDSRIEARKTRSTYAYGAYNPTYRIGYLPPNLFLPGRLYPPAPAPEPPSGDFVDFANIDTIGGKIPIVFNLINENITTKLDFGDGSEPVVITSGVIIGDHQYAAGTYTMRVSNPTNIDEILIAGNSNVKSVLIGDFTSLISLNLTDNTSLDEIFGVPLSLRTLNISGTAINTCELLGAFFDTLPDIGSGGQVTYTDYSCPSTGQCGGNPDIECNALSRGWTFSYT